MKLKRVEVLPILLNLDTTGNDPFDIDYEFPDETEVHILDIELTRSYMINFAEWYILKPEEMEMTDVDFVLNQWAQYKKMCETSWNMLFRALFTEYDPLNNYDITEDKSGSLTHTPDGVKDSVTVTVDSDNTKKPTSEHFVSTYASGEKAHDKTITTGKSTTTTESTIKSTYTDSDSHSIHRFGNAGVVTTSEVVRQETLLRKTELAAEIVLGGFVEKFMFYSGGESL